MCRRREGEAYFPVSTIDCFRHLDRNNIVIIGTVMAQTVALDHYAESVERMIVSFMRMNMKIEQSGNFDLLDKKDLYKLIASNNTVNTNVLSKVKPLLLHMHIHIYKHMHMLMLMLYLQTRTLLTNTYRTYNEQLGLFEGSDAAWENADYHITLEGERCFDYSLIFPYSCSHSHSHYHSFFYSCICSLSNFLIYIIILSSFYSSCCPSFILR